MKAAIMGIYYIYYCVCGFIVIFLVLKVIQSFARLQDIQNRPVLITGCDSGFGRLLAVHLDTKGVPVYAGCLKEESVESLRQSCSSRLKAICLNVADQDSVRSAAKFVGRDLGQKALWAVVNNAGVAGPVAPFEWTTKDDCLATLEVNLLGMYDIILKFVPLIRRGKQGRIVNMASAMGRITFAASPYAISKFAVEGLSDGLSYELDPFNITVHILEPGTFRTSLLETESQMKSFSACVANTSEDVKKVYGGEQYLLNFVQTNMKLMQSMASKDLHSIVKTYEHALFAKYPQTRYQIGLDANVLCNALSFFPRGVQMFCYKWMTKTFGGRPPSPKGAFKQ